jgi:DNA repair photolyase
MLIQEIESKSILTKSNIPSIDLVVNPYVGCEHGCIYCYADFMKRFTNHHEPWGEFLDVKKNGPELVKPRGHYEGKEVLFSSVTDPYLPHERKFEVTRAILKKLVVHQPKISILTKSELVKRDIDIFKQFNDIDIAISVSTINVELVKQLEPRASLPFRRFEALKACKNEGLNTHVFISPILPYITEIEQIMEMMADHVKYFSFENLNVRPNNRKRVFQFIKKNRPDLIPDYKKIYGRPPDNLYWDLVSQKILEIGKIFNVNCQIHFHHGGFSKNKYS